MTPTIENFGAYEIKITMKFLIIGGCGGRGY